MGVQKVRRLIQMDIVTFINILSLVSTICRYSIAQLTTMSIYSRSSVVCRSVFHTLEHCKNGWTDRDSVWGVDSGGPKEPNIRRDPDSHAKGQFWAETLSARRMVGSKSKINSSSTTESELLWRNAGPVEKWQNMTYTCLMISCVSLRTSWTPLVFVKPVGLRCVRWCISCISCFCDDVTEWCSCVCARVQTNVSGGSSETGSGDGVIQQTSGTYHNPSFTLIFSSLGMRLYIHWYIVWLSECVKFFNGLNMSAICLLNDICWCKKPDFLIL